MVRIKVVLDLAYVGTRYVGWQPQAPKQTLPLSQAQPERLESSPAGSEANAGEPTTCKQDDLVSFEGICKPFNKRRCRRGDKCRFLHACSHCWRLFGERRSHAACDGMCSDKFIEGVVSVQEAIDVALVKAFASSEALRSLFPAPPSGVVSSGRTDRGVHAHQMLAYFNCNLRGGNSDSSVDDAVSTLPVELGRWLPIDIRCRGAVWTSDLSFSTRGTARKTYIYYLAEPAPGDIIEESACQSTASIRAVLGCVNEGVWCLEGPILKLEPMIVAAKALVGCHDFGALSDAPMDAHDTVREVLAAEVELLDHAHFEVLDHCFLSDGRAHPVSACPRCRPEGTIECGKETIGDNESIDTHATQRTFANGARVRLTAFRITGRGFLKHMVRRIVGQLVAIGRGDAPVASMENLLTLPRPSLSRVENASDCSSPVERQAEMRRAPVAPACGLWLQHVEGSLPSLGSRASNVEPQ